LLSGGVQVGGGIRQGIESLYGDRKEKVMDLVVCDAAFSMLNSGKAR
jgi:hypothetical protein